MYCHRFVTAVVYYVYMMYFHMLCHGDALCAVYFYMFVLCALLLYTLCCVLLHNCLVIWTPSLYRCAITFCSISTGASYIFCCLLSNDFYLSCFAALYCLQSTAACFVPWTLLLCHRHCCCILQAVAVLHYILYTCCHMVSAYGHPWLYMRYCVMLWELYAVTWFVTVSICQIL